MYKIEKKDYGFKLTFGETIPVDEMKRWFDESKKALAGAGDGFGVFVDMRTLQPLLPEAQAVMRDGQALYKQKGMVRSVVILANPVITLQFKRIAKESGIYAWERYIDASSVANWEAVGVAWVRDGKDPDKK